MPIGSRKQQRRLILLSLLSVAIGLISGVVDWAFLRASAAMLSLTLTRRPRASFRVLGTGYDVIGDVPHPTATSLRGAPSVTASRRWFTKT